MNLLFEKKKFMEKLKKKIIVSVRNDARGRSRATILKHLHSEMFWQIFFLSVKKSDYFPCCLVIMVKYFFLICINHVRALINCSHKSAVWPLW